MVLWMVEDDGVALHTPVSNVSTKWRAVLGVWLTCCRDGLAAIRSMASPLAGSDISSVLSLSKRLSRAYCSKSFVLRRRGKGAVGFQTGYNCGLIGRMS